MNRTKWSAGALATAALLFAGLSVGVADAAPATVPAPTPVAPSVPAAVPSQFALPFMGAPLTLTVTTGPGGNLQDISVDPAAGMVATKLSPRAVVFANTDGTVKVTVKSKGNTQSVSAKAGALADLAGAGSWSGDIFGTGAATTVKYTVIDNAGEPDITVDDPGDPTAVVGEVQHSTDDDESAARVGITFVSGGQSRTLTISAKVEDGEAALRVTLSKLRGVAVDASAAAGTKTWNGLLCDGTAASISYTLLEDGTFEAVTATPEPSRLQLDDGDSKIDVRWGDHERVRIRARLENGQITLNVSEKIRCKDAADPTVNVPTSIDASSDDDEDDDEQGDDHGGEHHGDQHGDHGGDDQSDDHGGHGGHGGGDEQDD